MKAEYTRGTIVFHIEKADEKRSCVECGSGEIIKKGLFIRKLRTVPIGGKPVFLAVHLHRHLCMECGALKQEHIGLSDPRRRWTKALGRYVLSLLRFATIKDVADHLGMSWDTVKEIHKKALQVKFKRRKLKHIEYIGVDEIAVRKGHNYLTVVVDLESGAVIWVAEGRDSTALERFLRRLKRSGAKVKGIAMDMWPAYIKAALECYSSKEIVFDRYHIVSDYNKMLDELRRLEASAAPKAQKDVYKGVRYLLLKGEEKIGDGSKARIKLDQLLELNQSLNTAYVMKEDLRHLWECADVEEAGNYLDNWIQKAWSSGIKLLDKFGNRLASHRTGILNYFKHRITTGKVEGINNKIKVLKRKAYGFRDVEYFKLRIYNLHESRYALIG